MADSNDKGSLADQLAGLSISVKETEEEAPDAPAEPVRELTDEELFAQAMEGMSDEELAAHMSRKKPKPKPKSEKKGRGSLGEAFGDALADVSPVDSKLRRPAEPDAPKTPRGRAERAGSAKSKLDSDKPMSDDEIFAAAVDDLSPEDVYKGKYFGGTELPEAAQGPSIADYTQSELDGDGRGSSDEAETRDRVKDLQNRRMLEKALGGIDKKVDSSKYRVKQPKARPFSSEPNHDLNTDPLPKSGDGLSEVDLQGSHKELLKRYERRRRDQIIPELNVRGDTLDDALRQLELFAHTCWKEDRGFMRIIHGKGNQSEGDPVLKPAVLRWLEGPGFRYVRGYAPEVDRGGNYGAVIVELAKR